MGKILFRGGGSEEVLQAVVRGSVQLPGEMREVTWAEQSVK